MQKTVIEQILEGIKAGRSLYEKTTGDVYSDDGLMTESAPKDSISELCRGDNLAYMKRLLESGLTGKFKLIYINMHLYIRKRQNEKRI